MRANKLMLKTAPVLAALLIGGLANAEVKTVQVTAEVEAVEGDKRRTMDKAKDEARRLAVEEGAGIQVVSNTTVRDFEVVKDEITTAAKGVITNEKWGKLKVIDGVAKISLTAKVRPDGAASAVCSVLKANFDPRISAVIVEKRGNDAGWSTERGMVETMIIGDLMENCFKMVSPGIKVSEVAKNGDLPQATVDKIVENADAEFVLLGSVKMEQVQTKLLGSGMKSYTTSVNLKLISVDGNEIVATAAGSVPLLGISPENAISSKGNAKRVDSVLTKNLATIYGKVAEKWSSRINGSTVAVQVDNVPNYSASKKLERLIGKYFPEGNISKVRKKGKRATMSVTVKGGGESLAEKLEGKKVGKYTIEVQEVVASKVVLQLVK